VNVEKALEFEHELFHYMDGKTPEIWQQLAEKQELSPELEEKLKQAIENFKNETKL
jgi:F0F1-type ATP synthase alpha subunit